jgi:hypothetical protein
MSLLYINLGTIKSQLASFQVEIRHLKPDNLANP